MPASPTKPRRMSVTPATIQMRVPAGKPIIRATAPAPHAAPPHRRARQSAVAPSEAPRESSRMMFAVSACPSIALLPSLWCRSREPAADQASHWTCLPAVLADRAAAIQTPGSRSLHALAPRARPKRRAEASPRRFAASPPPCEIVALTPCPSLVWLAAKCPRSTFVDTIIVSTKAIILALRLSVYTA